MSKHRLHLHSMLVHSVIALSLVAAAAFLLLTFHIDIWKFSAKTWSFLTVSSIIVVFLMTLPSVLTGIFERGHVYAGWHSSHRLKLLLSILLIVFLVIELTLFKEMEANSGLLTPLGILIVFGNNIVCFLLGMFGLKITMGRQSFGKASYQPDLFKQDPVDVLVSAGEHRHEEAKYLDLLTER